MHLQTTVNMMKTGGEDMARCPVCGHKLPKIKIRKGKIVVIRYGECPNCKKGTKQ